MISFLPRQLFYFTKQEFFSTDKRKRQQRLTDWVPHLAM